MLLKITSNMLFISNVCANWMDSVAFKNHIYYQLWFCSECDVTLTHNIATSVRDLIIYHSYEEIKLKYFLNYGLLYSKETLMQKHNFYFEQISSYDMLFKLALSTHVHNKPKYNDAGMHEK